MYIHEMTFDCLLDKHIAIDWILQHVDVVDVDEHLTEKRLSFTTDIEVQKRTCNELAAETRLLSYITTEL